MNLKAKCTVFIFTATVAFALPSEKLDADRLNSRGVADSREGSATDTLGRSKRAKIEYKICLVTGNGWASGTSDQIYIRLGSRRVQWPSFKPFPKITLPPETTVCNDISGADLKGDATDVEMYKDGSDDWYPLEIRVSLKEERGHVKCSWWEKCGGRPDTCRFPNNGQRVTIPCGDYTTE